MAVRIRLLRMGRKKKPFYRIVVMDSRTRRDGRYIDKVGHYDPLKKPAEVTIDRDKVINWLEKGAEPSKTVFNILQKEGIALDWHLIRNKASEHVRNVEMQKFELAKKLREDKEASVGG
ncbi:MAG: 30S ribosomal protein S16, partial [Candidatus Neomarinimicrobiota bacterium]